MEHGIDDKDWKNEDQERFSRSVIQHFCCDKSGLLGIDGAAGA
jgi:hypothetical protein